MKALTTIHKTLSFMRGTFEIRQSKLFAQKISNQFRNTKQESFGTKSFRFCGPKIWNSIAYHIKSTENLKYFKIVIKSLYSLSEIVLV